MLNNQDNQRQQFVNWEVVEDFVAPDFDATRGGVCIRVSALPLAYPRFSTAVGWKYPNGDFKLHFQPGQPVSEVDVFELLPQALELASKMAKEVIEKREAEEAKKAQLLKEEQENKLRKKKQYEANVEARRVENRRRAGNSGKQK